MSNNGGFTLDNLVVTPNAAVPVPATLPLFGLGLAMLSLIKRRKR